MLVDNATIQRYGAREDQLVLDTTDSQQQNGRKLVYGTIYKYTHTKTACGQEMDVRNNWQR